MRIRIYTALAVAFLMVSATARAGEVFAGTIIATGAKKSVWASGPQAGTVACNWPTVTLTFETEITLNSDGSVLGKFTLVESMAGATGCGNSTFERGSEVVTAASLSALAQLSIAALWVSGPINITPARSGDSLLGSISGSESGVSDSGDLTLTASVSGTFVLKRKSCYEVGALQPLQGGGGSTEIVTAASCDCSISNLPSWFTSQAPQVTGELKRFVFAFGENTGDVPRDWGAQLTCGTESYRVNYSQARKGKYRPPTPRSPTNGVRGELGR
jgi:hypothetical protein